MNWGQKTDGGLRYVGSPKVPCDQSQRCVSLDTQTSSVVNGCGDTITQSGSAAIIERIGVAVERAFEIEASLRITRQRLLGSWPEDGNKEGDVNEPSCFVEKAHVALDCLRRKLLQIEEHSDALSRFV